MIFGYALQMPMKASDAATIFMTLVVIYRQFIKCTRAGDGIRFGPIMEVSPGHAVRR